MIVVNRPLTKFHFSLHFGLQFVNGRLVDAPLTAPTFAVSYWLLVCAVISRDRVTMGVVASL